MVQTQIDTAELLTLYIQLSAGYDRLENISSGTRDVSQMICVRQHDDESAAGNPIDCEVRDEGVG